jgi:hypothetical protein
LPFREKHFEKGIQNIFHKMAKIQNSFCFYSEFNMSHTFCLKIKKIVFIKPCSSRAFQQYQESEKGHFSARDLRMTIDKLPYLNGLDI